MSENILREQLRRVVRRQQWSGLGWKLAACWAIAALAGAVLIWIERATGWSSPAALPIVAGLAAAAVTTMALVHGLGAPGERWAAQKIEAAHPELKGVLLTAVQQNLEPGAEPNFLQHRVLEEAVARSREQDWSRVVPFSRVAGAHALQLLALAGFVLVLANLKVAKITGSFTTEGWVADDGMAVTPGDTSIEKGDSLVVLAKFGRTLPSNVNLVVRETAAARTIPLVKSLADPVFGGSVPEVVSDFTYRVEYGGKKTRDFTVKVYEHPKLVRADADLTFPDYTKLPPKHIDETRRVSAVEGTKVGFSLQLNKPVASAKLVARNKEKTVIPLRIEAGKPNATLPDFAPTASLVYDLQLVDADGRANKVSSSFVIDVQPNRPPELRLASPRGDVRPSALEEVAFEGTVFDDFGSPSYGLSYEVSGGATKSIELGKNSGAKEKRAFNYTLKLEDLGAKPDDLISWHVWAEDIGPDGKVRRTEGDLFFGEVRPFDEIFRESQQQQDQQQQQQGGGGGGATRKLTDLQKQIINATWKLQRDGTTPKYTDDEKVVTDSQEQALAQAGEAKENATAVRAQTLWTAVTGEMQKALEKLQDAAKSTAPLAAALTAEQAAYQSLLKLQARETQVSRSRKGGGGGGGGGGNQRQIDQLDLTQAENRYETQRQAKAPQTAQRQEQLQVMNRLQELARRQQDLNERLKELQTALQESHTEQEKEDLKRRLKRLEEEQQQMLADADEVKQRMERPENQSSMAQEKQQLEETRNDLQKAAEAAGSGSVAQALAAGTRAQRALQQMRDDLRKENSSQFADDLREMRSDARDLAREQDELSKQIDALGNTQKRKSLSDSTDQSKLIEELAQQKEKMNKLVDRAQQISEQAENSEPLLSKQLYDSVRKVNTDDADTVKQTKQELANSGQISRSLLDRLDKLTEKEGTGKALELTGEMLRENLLPLARQSGQRARGEMDELRRGVERAAESVLGDDAEQLKLAQSELDSLTEQLRKEIAQAQGGKAGGQQSGDPSQQQPGGDQQGDQAGNQAGQQPGQQPGQQSGQQGGQQPGQQAGQQADGQAQANAGEPQQANGQEGNTPGSGQPQDGRAQKGGGQKGGGNQKGGNQSGRGQLANAGTPGGNNNNGGANGGARDRLDMNNLLNGGQRDAGGVNDGAYNGGAYNGGAWNGGPLLGGYFGPWTERLRDVETLLDSPELRDAVAAARERARLWRRENVAHADKPDWAVVQLQILKPLVEVRGRVAEELARRDSRDGLAPIDRDPVPNRFAESVRRYYEELGKDKPDSK